jgi:hypothetical protein
MAEGKTFKDNIGTLTDFMFREGGGFTWSDKHNSTFALNKLAVMHFTQKRTLDLQCPGKTMLIPAPDLLLKGKVVRVDTSYKYLGIHLDNQLHWTTQMHGAVAKATRWIMLYRCLTKPSFGLSAKFMRRLFITVAIPKITYGLDMWYTPPHKPIGKKKNTESVKALKKFCKLQRLATMAINSTLRTSPTDLLDAYSGFLPMDLLLEKICYRSMICICTLPPTNPVSHQAVEYFVMPARTHKTNIQKLNEIFDIDPTIFKTVPAVSRPPVFRLPKDVFIMDSKKEVIEQEAKDNANMKIYTDGSSQNGFIGASMVLYYTQKGIIGNLTMTLRCWLGPDTKYSVWKAEAAGLLMAL